MPKSRRTGSRARLRETSPLVGTRTRARRCGAILGVVVVLGLTGDARTHAETVKCQRAIAKSSAAFAQARTATLTKCEVQIVARKLTGVSDCRTEPKTQATLAKASAKLRAAIDKACGGDDKRCGGLTTNEDTPFSVGFPGVCPNFENGPCANAIDDCGGIADCLECIAEHAVDQATALYFGDLDPTDPKSQKGLNKCQQTIGKAGAAFLTAKSKGLQQCWDARFRGKHAEPCPIPGDGKAAAAIAKAESKTVAAICKACAGGDVDKNGICDPPRFDPQSDIGFAGTCPAVQVPAGADCGAIGPIDTIDRLIGCVDCVTEFKADCIDRSQVPALASYPPECNPGASATPTPGPTSTPSPTAPPLATGTPSATGTPTATATPTSGTTASVTPTITGTPTATTTPSVTATSTSTTTPSVTATPTATTTPTVTGTPTATVTSTPTIAPTPTSTPSPATCFAAGTLVATADGPLPIEQIRPGDRVQSFDVFTGRVVQRRVRSVEHKHAASLIDVRLASGERVAVTPDHYFWVLGSGWVRARELRPDDALQALDGAAVALAGVESPPLHRVAAGPETRDVYNLVVEEFDNYFVGTSPVLVHSCPVMGFSKLTVDSLPFD